MQFEDTIEIDYATVDLSILNHIKCTKLSLKNITLSSNESSFLNNCLSDGVKEVEIGPNVIFDLEKILLYNGNGSCNSLSIEGEDTKHNYWKGLETWAASNRWFIKDNCVMNPEKNIDTVTATIRQNWSNKFHTPTASEIFIAEKPASEIDNVK